MLSRVRGCYQLRALRGRRNLGLWLSRADQAALSVLERFFDRAEGRREHRRVECAVPTSYRVDAKHSHEGTIRDISATGAWVDTTQPLPEGSETTLRVTDPQSAREYHFACVVVRRVEGGMGVELVGIPVECRHNPASVAAATELPSLGGAHPALTMAF